MRPQQGQPFALRGAASFEQKLTRGRVSFPGFGFMVRGGLAAWVVVDGGFGFGRWLRPASVFPQVLCSRTPWPARSLRSTAHDLFPCLVAGIE